MDKKKIEKKQVKIEMLLTFLKETKEGKYARIDEYSLSQSRFKEVREDPYSIEGEYYYYGIR